MFPKSAKQKGITSVFFAFLSIVCLYSLSSMALPQAYAQETPETSNPPDRCVNVITNGSMEDDSGWRIAVAPMPARYVAGGRNDSRALLIGPTGSADVRGQEWSSALQEITVPEGERIILSLWYRLEQGAAVGSDRSQIALLDSDFAVLDFLLTEIEPADNWQSLTVDVSEYAGETLQLFFGVRSDGATGSTYLYIDDVQLCDAQRVAAVPEMTPQATRVRFTPDQPAEAQTEEPAATEPNTPVVGAETQPDSSSLPTETQPITPTTPAPTATPLPQPGADDSLELSQLGIADLTLQGPSDAVDILFSLPATWQPTDNATLQLRLDTFLADADADVDTESLLASGAALGIVVNGTSLRTVSLTSFGFAEADVSIPASVLRSPRPDGYHHLRIMLGSGPVCTVDKDLGVAIRSSSRIVVPHALVALSTDLALLPRPIFQDAGAPDAALIVVPNAATPGELQAALSVAAGLGRMTAGQLDLTLLPAGDLTTQLRDEHHLILVGTAAQMPVPGELNLPAPLVDGAFVLDGISPDDGIVQMISSPWNSARAILLVSGSSDSAVQKAAQAVSSGTLRASSTPELAVVTEVRSAQTGMLVNTNRSLADLGHPARTIAGSGAQALQYPFALPDLQSISGDAYVNLFFNHATTIDYDRSSAIVLLNDQPVRGLDLSKDSAQLNSVRITLPRAALRAGNNMLEVRADLVPRTGCSLADQTGIWFTIWPDSLLHTPIQSAQSGNATASLSDFPSPFTGSAGLGTTALVVAKDDVQSWDVAARIASGLGQYAVGQTINPAVFFADTLPETARSAYNLILIGQPDKLPVISELADSLPADVRSNATLNHVSNRDIVYRLAQDGDTGYLAVIRSPWNARHSILTILGNSGSGVQQAALTLVEPASQQTLTGDFALIEGQHLITGVSTDPALAVAEQAPDALLPSNRPARGVAGRPAWVLPVIVIAIILIIGMLAYGIYSSWRTKHPARL